MAIKTILVHADASRHAPARYAMAAALALAHGAHLTGAAATGVSALVYPAAQGGLPGGLLDSYFGALREQLDAVLDHFARTVDPLGVEYDKRLLIDAAGDGLVALSAHADLLVLSQDDPAESLAHGDQRLPDYVIVNAPRPVLLVPNAYAPAAATPAQAPQRILVAWNGSRQAAAAVGHALPLLRAADSVTVATFGEDPAAPQRAAGVGAGVVAGTGVGAHTGNADHADHADLLVYLRRHGIAAAFDARPEPVDMGHALLALAHQHGCDLIVMGCYGHARLRELCLGGVSRTLLRSSPVPLLMAHV